jgi:hypothetical protein
VQEADLAAISSDGRLADADLLGECRSRFKRQALEIAKQIAGDRLFRACSFVKAGGQASAQVGLPVVAQLPVRDSPQICLPPKMAER